MEVYILTILYSSWDYEANAHISGVYLTEEAAIKAGKRFVLANPEERSYSIYKEKIKGKVNDC